MTDESPRQPTHQSIMVAIARVETSLTSVAERQKEHIKESQESREKLFSELSMLNARTAVLESHEDAKSFKMDGPLIPTPRTRLEQVGMWAGLIVGLPTIATVLQALWGAIGHLIANLAEK